MGAPELAISTTSDYLDVQWRKLDLRSKDQTCSGCGERRHANSNISHVYQLTRNPLSLSRLLNSRSPPPVYDPLHLAHG